MILKLMWGSPVSRCWLVKANMWCRTMVALHFARVQYAHGLNCGPCSMTSYPCFSLMVRQHALYLLDGCLLSGLQQAGGSLQLPALWTDITRSQPVAPL